MCRVHYNRWYNHGDPTLVKPHGRRGKGRQGCQVEGCSEPHFGKGYCRKHYRRFEKYGDPSFKPPARSGESHPHWTGDAVTYAAAHTRLRKERGKASEHLCVDCGKRAAEWSYIGSASDERVEVDRRGKRLPFSADPKYYAPRCHSCHVLFDKRRE
jgi:hypothetical protein